jgi:hypothetical protein
MAINASSLTKQYSDLPLPPEQAKKCFYQTLVVYIHEDIKKPAL